MVRVRDHIALSTAGTAMLYPWAGRRVLAACAGSILVDVDHYLWFCWHRHTVNPLATLRFFNLAQPPQHAATRLFHSPEVLLSVLLLGICRKRVLPVAVGMCLHVAMDAYHAARMGQTRTAALRRDRFTCQACGARGVGVSAHVKRQPLLFPSYRVQNLITLCCSCHEAAHAGAPRPTSVDHDTPLIDRGDGGAEEGR